MIVSLFLELIGAVIDGMLGLIPDVDVPSWLSDRNALLTTALGWVSGLGAWFPFGLAGAVIGTLFVLIVVSFGIKVIRIALSYATLGGGSAG